MRSALLHTILAFLFCATLRAQTRTDQCVACHQTVEDRPTTQFMKDIHYEKGLSCADCHGGNRHAEEMEQGMDPRAGFIGVPRGDRISATCQKCHSEPAVMQMWKSNIPLGQAEQLQASVHGRLSVTGKERLLQCTTCHGSHGIASVRNPASPVHSRNVTATCARCHSNAAYMRSYNPSLPIDQLEKYRTSVHGILHAKGDAKVAECASCHGSHDIRPAGDVKSAVYATNLPATCAKCHADAQYMKPYRIPTDQHAKFTGSVHGIALLQKKDLAAPSCNDCHGNHGAAPPGLESVSKVCGTCHALNAELFSASPHKKAFDAQRLPECETCHSNHDIVSATDQLLGVSSQAVCARCHSADQNPKGFAVAQNMRMLIDSLEAMEREASTHVEEAEQRGMEISEAKFRLRDARQARLQARTMVHSFDEGRFRDVIKPGMEIALSVSGEAREAIDEYYFRRWGLGISSLIITVLALTLYVYIRRIERNKPSDRMHG